MNKMKYIESYLEEELKIKALAKIVITPCSNGEDYGYVVNINGRRTGIIVKWQDYAKWLETKIYGTGFNVNQ